MVLLTLIVITGLVTCAAQQKETATNDERKVKGQQYVTQSVIAKVIGHQGFNRKFLDMIRNENVPITVDNNTLIEGPKGSKSALITENVRTTVTRIIIPLNPSFMDSDWYRETLKRFLQKNRISLFNNNTEKGYSEDGKIDIDLITLKLWAAAIVRDNVITVFGTLLYDPNHDLPGDLHSSLSHLYELIRLRRISTIGFLDVLEKMSFEDPQEQFKILFQKLEKHVPQYMRSCVTYWLEYLYTNQIDINKLLINEQGVLVVDFLTGIDSSALLLIKQKVLFSKEVAMTDLPQSEVYLGKMMSHLLIGIYNKSILLTRKLFAGILLHLPQDKFIPDADEYKRYFADMVKKGNENDEFQFQNAIANLNMMEYSNPYDLVKDVFKSLITRNTPHREIYEALLINVQEASRTFSLRNFDVMAPIMNSKRINMEILLNRIVLQEYPPDIVDAKDRLLYYMDKNYIDFDFALRGFIKNQQSSPFELLIAALTRLETIYNNYPELYLTITSLKAHIIYKKQLNDLKINLSVGDLTSLLLSFQTPNLPQNLRDIAAELRVLLPTEFVSIDTPLDHQSTVNCGTPRQCIVSILQYTVTKNQFRNKVCEMKARKFLDLVTIYGEPIGEKSSGNFDSNYHNSPGEIETAPRFLYDPEEVVPTIERKEIYPGKHSPALYKNHNITRKIYEYPIFISKINSGKVVIKGQNGEIFFISETPQLNTMKFNRVPILHPACVYRGSDLMNLLPIMNQSDKRYMAPIEILLQKDGLIKILDIDPESYVTRGALLIDILKKSLNITEVFENEEQRSFAESYLTLLEYTYAMLPPPPPLNSNDYEREVNIQTLLQAIPIPHDEKSEKRLNALKKFLNTEDLSNLSKLINVDEYPSKGSYLKRLLQLLLRNDVSKDEELSDIIRYFIKKVMTSGYGAQPLDWILIIDKKAALGQL